jgi:glycerol-3-phosphate dehydrogenase
VPDRAATGTDDCDLLVIGGGITGCAIARDAAARRLRVRLIERKDLAAGTSGRSTKLLHGGLRYLEHGHLGLVREALREREITARLAPGLARPLRIILPVWPGASPGRWTARAGVALYRVLAGGSELPRGGPVSRSAVEDVAPSLRDGYTGGVEFYDRQTDDARLTVAIARDAAARGARIELGVELTGLARRDGWIHAECRAENGASSTIAARCAVNAAGAWADRIRRLAGLETPMLQASRGAHLVLRGFRLDAALLVGGRAPKHRLFAIPWRGRVLFGTTDVADHGDPGRDVAEIDDLRLLFEEARRAFPSAGLTRSSVLSAFTGVRPLVLQKGSTLGASREHVVRDEDGLITIAGGKLTTWRTMAIDAVDAAVRRLGLGTASPEALLREPFSPGAAPESLIEAVIASEWPRHAEDVVFRRLPVGHDPAEVSRVLPEVIRHMSMQLGWAPTRAAEERDRVLAGLDAQAARLDAALGRAVSA